MFLNKFNILNLLTFYRQKRELNNVVFLVFTCCYTQYSFQRYLISYSSVFITPCHQSVTTEHVSSLMQHRVSSSYKSIYNVSSTFSALEIFFKKGVVNLKKILTNIFLTMYNTWGQRNALAIVCWQNKKQYQNTLHKRTLM